jgi:pyruvate dehydrogenase E1 component alpha subunit
MSLKPFCTFSNDVNKQVDLYFNMLRIRRVEEAIADHYKEQKMRTPVHLSIGQEAVAAAVGYQLRHDDYAVSTHRGHAHYLAKGGSLKSMIAEIHGKVTGCCRGRGGSMHLIDRSVGFMGSTAIVGNTIPIGVGLGLSIKLSQKNAVSCVFIGDGAVEEGVFFESLNFAILKKLPVLFICENNRYSVYSPFDKRQPAERKIHEVAAAMGAKTNHADGYDLLTNYEVVHQAIDSMRKKSEAHFLEFETYRWREHCGPNYDNDIGYRTEEEYLAWRKRDPVETFKIYLMDRFQLSESHFYEMEKNIQKEIEEAFEFAELSDFPEAIEAITGQYKELDMDVQRTILANA